MNGDIQHMLFDREMGLSTSFDLLIRNSWSLSNSIIPELPLSTKILSVDCQENYAICLTAKGQGYLINTFQPEEIFLLGTTNEHILKLSFFENSVFIVLINCINRDLKFFSQPLPITTLEDRTEILKSFSISFDDFCDYDIYNQNLMIYNQNTCKIISLATSQIIFQQHSITPFYSRNHAIFIRKYSDTTLITSLDLSNNKKHFFSLLDTKDVLIMDHFDDVLFFAHNQKIKAYDFGLDLVREVSEMPKKYYIGKENSIAQYQDGMRIMHKSTGKIDLNPSLICADLVNIIAVYVQNRGVFVLDISGSIRQVIFPTAKIRAMSMNRETGQLVLCGRRNIYFYD